MGSVRQVTLSVPALYLMTLSSTQNVYRVPGVAQVAKEPFSTRQHTPVHAKQVA
jgi:hypothetical protein